MVAATQDLFPGEFEGTGTTSWVGSEAGQLSSPMRSQDVLESQLRALAALRYGWDSYGAPAISKDSLALADATSRQLMSLGMPVPHLVPTPNGTVQAEWHANHRSLELEFITPISMHFYYANEISGDEQDQILDFDFMPLFRRIPEFRPDPVIDWY